VATGVTGAPLGAIIRSVDLGLTWGAFIANPFGVNGVYAATFGNGVFVAGDIVGEISRSVDLGQTWSPVITNPLGGSSIGTLSYNFGTFQVSTYVGGKTARSYDNGLTWGNLCTNPFGTLSIWGIASSDVNLCMVGENKTISLANWNPAYSLFEPVFTELSIGTFHPFQYDGTARAVVNGVAGAAAWSAAVSCAAFVPIGARAIKMQVLVQTGSAAAGQVCLAYAFDNKVTVVPTYMTHPVVQKQFNAAGASAVVDEEDSEKIIPLNASREFYYYRTFNVNTATPQLYVVLLGWYG
jgi:hypothetical protein